MDIFIAWVGRVSQLCGVIAALLLAAAVLVVCEMVVLRYFLNASTIWQTEFVIYSLVAATFIGSPYVLLRRGHVNVDLLPLYLGHRGRVALALIASLAALAFTLVVAWTGFVLWREAWDGGWRTDTVWELPLWISYLPLPLGIGLLALQYVADILSLLTGRAMPFGLDPGERP
ncbi:MAG: TRAP transporter small permease [Alphaproteobacteria bacterium]